MANFKIGDVVQLKSGGPQMTISELSGAPGSQDFEVKCIWFEKSKQLSNWFVADTLIPANNSGNPSVYLG
jgi:uncharacterized protein YodC (DUF2158 family)